MDIIIKTKIPFFLFHIFYIFVTIFLPTFYPKLIFMQIITILSWLFNKNQCLLTQFEYYLYKHTLIEYVSKRKIKNKFIVPYSSRFILHSFFTFNCIKAYYTYNRYYIN